MTLSAGPSITGNAAAELETRLHPRLRVEEYFERSGRTLRKSRSRLWVDESLKPALMRFVFRILGLYGRGKQNARQPRVRQLDVRIPGLPAAFDGFTVLQISDVHIDGVDGLAEALAKIVEPLRPDLCVLTGDYRYEIRGSCAGVYPRLAAILDGVHARLGIIGILGNHDAAEIARWLNARGVRMLVNDAIRLSAGEGPAEGNDAIWIAGVDDPYDYRCHDLPLALASVPENACKILLAHTPGLYREAAAAGVAFYLCGHTHAGQIRLPGIGALKKNGNFPRALVQDFWVYKAMHAYTSWGAGCSTLPVRFHCPAEVALLRFRCQ